MKTIYLILILIPLPLLQAQQIITLKNPSFEGVPSASTTPASWVTCGMKGTTPVDIQPNGGFEVSYPAFHGKTYVGMVSREDNSWESVSQELSSPIEKGKKYAFSLYLNRSVNYLSYSLYNQQKEKFNHPISLIIWGGNTACGKVELLAQSPLINGPEWKKFDFVLAPKDDYSFIILEAYPLIQGESVNGNLLVDHCSEIREDSTLETTRVPVLEAIAEQRAAIVLPNSQTVISGFCAFSCISMTDFESKKENFNHISRINRINQFIQNNVTLLEKSTAEEIIELERDFKLIDSGVIAWAINHYLKITQKEKAGKPLSGKEQKFKDNAAKKFANKIRIEAPREKLRDYMYKNEERINMECIKCGE